MSTLERVNEACRLRAFMPNNREFVVSMADIFGCHPLKADGDALYHFLETIYNYGRVEGIRQERKHKKEAIT
jgi:hypothetical protein